MQWLSQGYCLFWAITRHPNFLQERSTIRCYASFTLNRWQQRADSHWTNNPHRKPKQQLRPRQSLQIHFSYRHLNSEPHRDCRAFWTPPQAFIDLAACSAIFIRSEPEFMRKWHHNLTITTMKPSLMTQTIFAAGFGRGKSSRFA